MEPEVEDGVPTNGSELQDFTRLVGIRAANLVTGVINRERMRAQKRIAELEEHCEHMANLLMAYAYDEDRFLKQDGEPYGSISTDVGIMARAAVRQYAKK